MSIRDVELLVCDECETTEIIECSHDLADLLSHGGWVEFEPDEDHKPRYNEKYHLCLMCRQPEPVAGVPSVGEPW